MIMNEILLIDDNFVDNYINEMIVTNEKIATTITVMLSPIEALEYLENKKDRFPELIFLDIKMPKMDGFDFLKKFSKLSGLEKGKCNVVMLSSSQNVKDIDAAKNNPFVLEYLMKPLDSSKLNNVLKMIS